MSLERLNQQLRDETSSSVETILRNFDLSRIEPEKEEADFSRLINYFEQNKRDTKRLLPLMTVLKGLIRNDELREEFPIDILDSIPSCLSSQKSQYVETSPEFRETCGYLLSNICRSFKLSTYLLNDTTTIASSFGVLTNPREEYRVKASACAILQGLSVHVEGKQRILQFPDSLKVLSSFLFRRPTGDDEGYSLLKERVLGALNNLTTEFDVAVTVRDLKLVPVLVRCLESKKEEVFKPAIGCLQNISRDVKSRDEILQYGGVEGISKVLFSKDVEAQKCAAVVLLNLSHSMDVDDPRRVALKKILSLSIFMGQMVDVFSSLPKNGKGGKKSKK